MANLQHTRIEPLKAILSCTVRRGAWRPHGLYLAAANLLVAVLSFGLIAPALESESQSKLPACCRRDGKHHCAAAMTAPSSGPVLQDSSGKCPRFPGTKFVVPPDNGYVRTASLFYRVTAFNPRPTGPTAPPYRISISGIHPKRGPPFLLS